MNVNDFSRLDQTRSRVYVGAPMSGLAYVHPAMMLALLALSLWVLRLGLGLRRARLAGRRASPARHRRIARVVVPLLALGYLAGLGSMLWIRGAQIAESVHFPLASTALLAILGAGALGLRLSRAMQADARARARAAHALFGAVGVLFALVAAVAGMAILP